MSDTFGIRAISVLQDSIVVASRTTNKLVGYCQPSLPGLASFVASRTTNNWWGYCQPSLPGLAVVMLCICTFQLQDNSLLPACPQTLEFVSGNRYYFLRK